MSSARRSWKPTSAKKGSRNSGTKDSINDRPCDNCGVVREHKQRGNVTPPRVWCAGCSRTLIAEGTRICPTLRMKANKEEAEELACLRREACTKARDTKSARVVDDVAAKLEEKPRATQDELDAEHDGLWDQIKGGRPAAGELFWRQLCGLVCLCNCAICLLAVLYSPTVFMVFCYLWGCIPAKKGDVVAIPKVYIEWAVAVATLMNKRYPGRVHPWAFIGLRALETAPRDMPRYGGNFDSLYDEKERVYESRVSIIPGNGQDPLMPGAMYDPERDYLGVYSSESAGTSGVAVLKIPLLIKDDSGRYRKTVVEAKCRRRQIVMAFLFTSVLAALSWVPLARDFAVLKGRAEDPATIGVQISN